MAGLDGLLPSRGAEGFKTNWRCKLCDIVKPEPEDCMESMLTVEETRSLLKFLNMDETWGDFLLDEMWYCADPCMKKIRGIHQWTVSGKAPEGQDLDGDKVWIWGQLQKCHGDIIPADANTGKPPEKKPEPKIGEIMRIMKAKQQIQADMAAKLKAEGKFIEDLSWEERKNLELAFPLANYMGAGGASGSSSSQTAR